MTSSSCGYRKSTRLEANAVWGGTLSPMTFGRRSSNAEFASKRHNFFSGLSVYSFAAIQSPGNRQ